MSQDHDTPTIKVRLEVYYGRQTVYPLCETSETFASIAGTKTLTKRVLGLIQDLGYAIEVETPDIQLRLEQGDSDDE